MARRCLSLVAHHHHGRLLLWIAVAAHGQGMVVNWFAAVARYHSRLARRGSGRCFGHPLWDLPLDSHRSSVNWGVDPHVLEHVIVVAHFL